MPHPVTSLLAATDLQRTADHVVGVACAVARRTGADLHLVHAFTSDAVPRDVRARDPEAEGEAYYEAREGLRIEVGELTACDGIEIDREVVRARRADEGIVDRARATAADLIVLGSHARAMTSHRLGSTADRVLRTSPVPCLVVRGDAEPPFRRGAVLTDFSEPSGTGLRIALATAMGLAAASTSSGPRSKPAHERSRPDERAEASRRTR